MKINIWTILFLVLVALGLGLWWRSYSERKTKEASIWDRDFAVKNVDEIDKIILTKRGSESIVLQRKEKNWELNSKFDVHPNVISNLLDAIRNVSMVAIPPKPSYDLIIRDFGSFGLKTQIFGKNDEILKTYYIGGVTNDESGVYFMMEGSKQPYVVSLNKGVSNIRARYDIAAIDWREKALFKVVPENIQSVQVDFPFDHQESFKITSRSEKFDLTDLNGNLQKIKDPTTIVRYVNSFSNIGFEAFENTNPERSLISTMTPFMKIKLTTKTMKEIVCDFYPINESTDKLDLSREFLNKGDFFRMFVNRNDGDFILLQYSQLGDASFSLSDFTK